jgi:hypothetical protein
VHFYVCGSGVLKKGSDGTLKLAEHLIKFCLEHEEQKKEKPLCVATTESVSASVSAAEQDGTQMISGSNASDPEEIFVLKPVPVKPPVQSSVSAQEVAGIGEIPLKKKKKKKKKPACAVKAASENSGCPSDPQATQCSRPKGSPLLTIDGIMSEEELKEFDATASTKIESPFGRVEVFLQNGEPIPAGLLREVRQSMLHRQLGVIRSKRTGKPAPPILFRRTRK